METIDLGLSGIHASKIALGCWRISKLAEAEATRLLQTALDEGINLFDHADIYGGGQSEALFAKAAAGIKRESIILQTKCGIRNPGTPQVYYDFSREHILEAVEGSLKRLHTDYIDILLLHRPDTLMEPEEIAEAFTILHRSGKVRAFGVSNCKTMQVELLKKFVPQKLIANQLQFGPAHTGMVDTGFFVNTNEKQGVERDGSILEYCRLKDITIQAWSPFFYGYFEGVFLASDQYAALNQKLSELARKYGVSESAVTIAWILRHPAKIQAIVGTTSAERLKSICAAASITLTRAEWYEIYAAAGNHLP
jgi:predicted oxidoreductase